MNKKKLRNADLQNQIKLYFYENLIKKSVCYKF